MDRNFMQLLRARWEQDKFVCVGLDTKEDKVPAIWPPIYKERYPSASHIFQFNQWIVDQTADAACAFKPNSGFYEAMSSSARRDTLRQTVEYIHDEHPDIPVIMDGKRNDIGATAEAYAKAAFDVIGADALTINPYLGQETNKPFLERTDKGIIVLCRTSNPGAGELQDLLVRVTADELEAMLNGYRDLTHEFLMKWGEESVTTKDGQSVYFIPLYQIVAMRVAHHWNKHGNCALVVGATYPEELRLVRHLVGDLPILVPGIGKQGGDLKAVIRNGLDSRKQGLIINSSSGIIYASDGPDFAQAARLETLKLHEQIAELRQQGA